MRRPFSVLTLLLFAVAGSSCATADNAAADAPAAVQHEYRTGSRFPVKDAQPVLTQQERDRQIDDARAAGQTQTLKNSQPSGATGR
jgi:hypothetical protein